MKRCLLAFVLLVAVPLVAQAPMSPAAMRPKPLLDIPRDLSEATERDIVFYEKEALPFFREQLVDTFDAEKAPEGQRADILLIREGLARYYASAKLDFAFSLEAKKRAESLYKAGCRDPAVQLGTCINAGENFGWWTAPKRMRDALKACDPQRDTLLRVLCAQAGCSAGSDKDKADFARRLREALAAAKPLLVKAPPRVLVRLMDETACHDAFGEDYDPYVRACLCAKDWMGEAFAARGTGWASKVTEEGWDGWRKMNGKAREALKVAVRLHPDWPEALLIRASLEGRHGNRSEALRWMNRALACSPDAARHVGSVTHYLTSRWGGSTATLRGLIEEAATSEATRTLLPYFVTKAALYSLMRYELAAFPTPRTMLEDFYDPTFRAQLYAMADRYLAQPDKPSFFPDDNTFAAIGLTIAVYARDWENVRRYRAKLRRPISTLCFDFGRYAAPKFCELHMSRVVETIGSSNFAERLILAEELLDEKKFEQAINLYEGVLKEKSLSSRNRTAVEYRRFIARILQGEAQGTPIDLMPSPEGSEAEHWYGTTKTGKDGRARNSNNKKAYYFAKTLIPCIGRVYEARVHFLPDGKKKQQRWEIGWGLAHPIDCDHVGGRPMLRFVRDAKGDRCEVLQYVKEKGRVPVLTVPLARADAHTFAFGIASPTEARLWLDGQSIDLSGVNLLDNAAFRNELYGGCTQPIWELYTNVAFDRYLLRPLADGE